MKTKFYITILSVLLSIFTGLSPSYGQPTCGPGAGWVQSCLTAADDLAMPSTARIQVSLDPGVCSPTLTLDMTGPVTVHRFGAQNVAASDGVCSHVSGLNDVIPTEITSMSLIGVGAFTGFSLYAGTALSPGGVMLNQSLGNIIENSGDNTLACSYFDVFFEIKTPTGAYIYNHVACRLASTIDRVPPLATYNSPVTGTCILLYDHPTSGISVANLYGAKHALTLTGIFPTLPQWGLILFTLLVLALGMSLVYRRQNALVVAADVPQEIKQSLFNRSLYFKVLGIVLLISVIGLAFANYYFNGLNKADTLGTILSACIVAYMVQLLMVMRRK